MPFTEPCGSREQFEYCGFKVYFPTWPFPKCADYILQFPRLDNHLEKISGVEVHIKKTWKGYLVILCSLSKVGLITSYKLLSLSVLIHSYICIHLHTEEEFHLLPMVPLPEGDLNQTLHSLLKRVFK